jgi:hypothetical protein
MMEIIHKQTKRYGCSIYTLANLFNEPKFLDYIVEDQGGFVEYMNRAVRELFPGYWLSALFVTRSYNEVQNRFYDVNALRIDTENITEKVKQNGFRAFIMSVKYPFVHHAILVVHCFKDGLLYVFNSLREQSEVYSMEEFVLKFWVCEIYEFESEELRAACTWGAPPQTLFFKYDSDLFKHLKPEQ